jgi:mannose-1-phosphate guanylyltransferase
MKAFLLAAGHGTRLRPYTDSLPKCLLPIQGVPMLEIWLCLCRKYGISEVLVNTHAHSGAVLDFVRKWRNGIEVTVIEETQLFGSAGTLRANRGWLGSDETFWVFYADVLTHANLDAMLKFHSPDSAATLGVYSVPDPERCGIVCVDQDRVITDFVEKPHMPKSHWAFAGIMIGTTELLRSIPEKSGADIAFDVLPRLVGRMRAFPISEFLIDIGTLENYQQAQTIWPGLETNYSR